MKNALFPILLLLFGAITTAEAQSFQSKRHPKVTIRCNRTNTNHVFSIEREPYLQPAATSDPYFSYFWDFGDGHFSLEKKEAHHTFAKAGKYTVRLYLTPCGSIDFVENPAEVEVIVPQNAVGTPRENYAPDVVNITPNHNLRAGENMIAAVGYRNNAAGATAKNGTLFLFFNEKRTSKTIKLLNVESPKIRNYNGERLVLTSPEGKREEVKKGEKEFLSKLIFEIPNVTPSVSNIFLPFANTPEVFSLIGKKVMIRAVFVVNGIVITKDIHVRVDQSHDPNDIDVEPDNMSFRKINSKTFDYKIRFQNTGNGIQPSVFVKATRPKTTDPTRFELVEVSPNCPICPDGFTPKYADTSRCFTVRQTPDSLEFRFYGINLRGKKQAGVKDMTLTEGYIRYRLFPKKGIRKINPTAQAFIDFSGTVKKTNKATVNFKPGLSVGPRIGLNFDQETGATSWFVGAVMSSYKPVGFYPQFEIFADATSLKRPEIVTKQLSSVAINADDCDGCSRDSVSVINGTVKQNAFGIVPLHLRWDVSKVLSIGFGASADVFFRKIEGAKYTETYKILSDDCKYNIVKYSGGKPISSTQINNLPIVSETDMLFKVNLFGDIAIGIDQFKIGSRFHFPFGENRRTYFQFYTQYKF